MESVTRNLLLTALAGGLGGCGDPGCGNRVIDDFPSPDGREHAIVFVRDCGATTDFSAQVSVLPAGDAVSGAGNVFIADADHGRAPRGQHGGPVVTARWAGNNELEIGYDERARVFKQEGQRGPTRISYQGDLSSGSSR